MNAEALQAIKAKLDQAYGARAPRDFRMNAKTWAAFKQMCWPGRMPPPNDAVRIWVDSNLPDGECQPGMPNTGWRVR